MMGSYHELLQSAIENKNSKPAKVYMSTKVKSAKKDPKEKKVSDNVKKFLAKQEEEERQKKKEAQKRMQNLLDLRNQDKKSKRTANSMLQRTKSSNKAVLADAINNRDTADTMNGAEQCDEDDYGYESKAAQALFGKLIKNYDANPEDPMAKFSKPVSKKSATDMSKVKNRVLERIEEDKLEELRHTRGSGLCTRKRKGTSSSTKADGDSSSSLTSYRPDFSSELKKDSEKKKNKKEMEREAARRRMEHNEKLRRKNAAATLPASSFTDLVKLASKSPSDKKKMTLELPQIKKRKLEDDRPMSKKQREDFERERLSHLRKTGKLPPAHLAGKGKASGSPSSAVETEKERKKKEEEEAKRKEADKKREEAQKAAMELLEKKKPKIVGPEFHPAVLKSLKTAPSSSSSSSKQGMSSSKSASGSKSPSSSSKAYRPGPASSKRPGSDQGSSSSHRHRQQRSPSRSPSPVGYGGGGGRRGNRIDSDYSEDEYDSEMDDFICDDDEPTQSDISKMIGSVFGYNRNKYRDEDDGDDRSMEVNSFSAVMKEEARSARIGRQEDLEDMRREEEEKKEKARRRKMKMKNRR